MSLRDNSYFYRATEFKTVKRNMLTLYESLDRLSTLPVALFQLLLLQFSLILVHRRRQRSDNVDEKAGLERVC